MSVSPTLLEGASYLSVLAELPSSLVERIVSWRAQHGLTGHWVGSCHITVLIGPDPGQNPLARLSDRLAQLDSFVVTLGSPSSFEPVTSVSYLPVVGGLEEFLASHSLCAEVVGQSVSPFPYIPHVTLVNQSDSALLQASLVDFSDLPKELTCFQVQRLGVYRFAGGSWRKLGSIELGTASGHTS